MDARDATEDDRPALAAFRCAHTAEEWDQEVEEWVRASLAWQSEDSSRRLKVVVDHDEIVGVMGYEPLDAADPRRGFWLSYFALSLENQGHGLGTDLFDNLVRTLAGEAPDGRLAWRVSIYNQGSLGMCSKLGFDEDSFSEHDCPGYLTFAISLPDHPI
ncbi:MAG: GNAT family N-acetyltransferase [Acidimicrobiales bacterium]